ncbi:MAG: hypothetical protein H0T77_16800 [Pyrinomonadaceae bacterium]|jgi:hypothetical protein|nr:hypothetical protein [Pyrinomonadaceae bacterium]
MKGIVIHHKGKIWRALEGRVSIGRLAIEAIRAVPLKPGGTSLESPVRRPVYFVFSVGGRTIAASKNVTLRKGRRYPGVEHWFVLPEFAQHIELNELQQPETAAA